MSEYYAPGVRPEAIAAEFVRKVAALARLCDFARAIMFASRNTQVHRTGIDDRPLRERRERGVTGIAERDRGSRVIHVFNSPVPHRGTVAHPESRGAPRRRSGLAP